MIKWKQLINKDTPTEWQTELLEARAFTQNGRIGRNFGDTSLLWHTPLQLVGSGGEGGKIFDVGGGCVWRNEKFHNLNWAKKAVLFAEIGRVKFFFITYPPT